LKKKSLALIVTLVAIALLVSVSLSWKPASAEPTYTIEQVNHSVEVMYNGYVRINDTIEVSGSMGDSFLLGFPYAYGSHVVQCTAYGGGNRSNSLPVSLGVSLEDRFGFYGVEVGFPSEAPAAFNVEFVLSNELLTQDSANASLFTLYFPGFPALTQPAAVCNGSIMLPQGAQFIKGSVGGFNYSAANLPAFSNNVSQVTFLLSGDKIEIFDIDELSTEIRVNEFGGLSGSDSYYITNRGSKNLNFVEAVLPLNASGVSAEDQFGRTLQQPEVTDIYVNRYKIFFSLAVEPEKSSRFSITYTLPTDVYLKKSVDSGSLMLNVTFFGYADYYLGKASVTFVLPEGATLVDTGAARNSSGIGSGIFQQTLTVTRSGVASPESFTVEVAYTYSPIWLAFRPTIWACVLSVIGCAAVVVWQRPKAPVHVVAPAGGPRLRPDFIRSFVGSYEEKMKILAEIDSLEAKVQKGKIPRRRYKVQKKTLEVRLSSLSRGLEESRARIRSAGGQYSDFMRQLEVAETEIGTVPSNIRNIESRHSRGDLSLEAYRGLLADYQRQKERAEATINGILLRLREETH